MLICQNCHVAFAINICTLPPTRHFCCCFWMWYCVQFYQFYLCSKVLKMPRKKVKAVKKVLEYEELNKDGEESEPPKARETSKKVRNTRISRKHRNQ